MQNSNYKAKMLFSIFKNLSMRPFSIFLAAIALYAFPLSSFAQNDTLLSRSKLNPDSTLIVNKKDSLVRIIDSLSTINKVQAEKLTDLQKADIQLQKIIDGSKIANDSLLKLKAKNENTIQSLQQSIASLNKTLDDKNQLLLNEENLLLKKDSELKDALHEAALNNVKLEGDINVNTTKVEAKDNEIKYLRKSSDEKDELIKQKSVELEMFYKQKNNCQQHIDSLQKNLTKFEIDLARTSEREKIVTQQYNELQEKQKEATNRKKKMSFIQGVALKFYRTPDWTLAPQSSTNTVTYVITNNNSGNLEFDYMTGLNLSLVDLSKKNSKFTYDAGLFVGFGGQNLFKNFYIGPSFKLFDVFHINFGANVAEYDLLKSGFNVGDPLSTGTTIPTVKTWKVNFYLGFTVDFDLLTSLPRKI